MAHPYRLKEKSFLLTGAGSAMGRAIAIKLTDCGANVTLLDTNEEKMSRLVDEITSNRELSSDRGRAFFVPCDVSKAHHVTDAVHRAIETFGAIDGYIDGMMTHRKFSWFEDSAPAELERSLDINLKGPILITQEVLKFVKGRRHGRLIYLLSDLARWGMPGDALGAATRNGLVYLTRSLARELASQLITVNCIAIPPSEDYLLEREPQSSSIRETQDLLLKQIPHAKLTNPDEVSEVAAFLASPLSSSITGQVLGASGGLHMG